MLSMPRARKPPYLARNEHFKKCAFFMRKRGAWLGLHEWREWALCGLNDAQDHAPSSPKI